ncbi:MAG: non-heme iron oxygenase ferredoxin subunit [Herpetosiphon sp.]
MSEAIQVATVDAVAPGASLQLLVAGREIALFNCEGTFYAVDNVCTHAYAHLSEGTLDTDDCTIECPLHGAVFDLRTGRVRALPATQPVQTYELHIVDGAIMIAVS